MEEEKKVVLDTEHFRKILKEQLSKIKCSQKQLAKHIDVSENTVSSWLSDNQKAQPRGLRLILSILEFLLNKDKDFNPIRLFTPDWEDPQIQESKAIISNKDAEICELEAIIKNHKQQIKSLEEDKNFFEKCNDEQVEKNKEDRNRFSAKIEELNKIIEQLREQLLKCSRR